MIFLKSHRFIRAFIPTIPKAFGYSIKGNNASAVLPVQKEITVLSHRDQSATVLDGNACAAVFRQELQASYLTNYPNKRPPGLAVIKVGEDPASTVYVNKKQEACTALGFHSEAYTFPESITETALLQCIDNLNTKEQIDGILVQLPLPKHINTAVIIERISPLKDVDGFHPQNTGLLSQQRPFLRPCTPFAIKTLLDYYKIPISGQDVVILGASNIVGRPLALEMLMAKATVTVCHSQTKNLAKHIAEADILISAMGKQSVVQSEWIKQGAAVLDVGIIRTKTGKITGDIDFETAKYRAKYITPVPGGVGPMTVTMLLHNTFLAYTKHMQG